MAISTYSELQTAVANWLERGDLTNRIPEFIALAESELRNDPRLQFITSLDFSTALEDYTLPSDFKALRNLSIDDADVRQTSIKIVRADELPSRKAMHGDTGVPRYAAVIDTTSPTLRFGPEPDQEYDFRMTYEAEIEALSDSNTTNRLLDKAPDIYLYAALVVAEPFLLEDERLPMWRAELERKLQIFDRYRKERQFGGRLTMMPRRSLGE